MKDHKSLYLDFYRDSLREIQSLIDAKVAALDEFSRKLQADIAGSDLSETLKHRQGLEELRSISTQQLVEVRADLDTRYAAFSHREA
jgi:hypothetical protein